MVEQLYGDFSVHDALVLPNPEYHPQIHNRSVDEAAWQRAETARRSLQLARSPALASSSGSRLAAAIGASQAITGTSEGNGSGNTKSRSSSLSAISSNHLPQPPSRKPLTIDEYAERMRMAAIMLAQLNASQQLPRSGTDAVTGVVGAGVGLGVNLTYGVGSVVGSVVGVGLDAVRATLVGSSSSSSATAGDQGTGRVSHSGGDVISAATAVSASSDVPAGQGASGVQKAIDPTHAASGVSSFAGSPSASLQSSRVNRSAAPTAANSSLPARGAGPTSQSISPTSSFSPQHQPRQRVLSAQEAATIRERIMGEMMALEEERMARMRASSSASTHPRGSSSRLSGPSAQGQPDGRSTWRGMNEASAHPETTEEESVVMRAVNKEDPSGAVFQESWSEKKSRIRKSSPYGHLASWDVISVIVKTGADLRQEQLAVQLIKEFGRIWTETKCPHWIRYFRILVTSESTGLMETITDAISVHSIKKDAYAKMVAGSSNDVSAPPTMSATGTSKDVSVPGSTAAAGAGYLPSFTLYDHFLATYGEPNSSKFRKAQDAFMKSLASYSIISYLLQIKDRHNGNILVDKQGHVIHIDFGFMLSNSPGSLGFEMAPFKLTQDYIDILGGMESAKFAEYRSLMKRQFRQVRAHAERIITMVELMQTDSKLPCFLSGEQTSQNLRDRFQLSLRPQQSDDFVDRLIISSAGSAFTRLYDTFQRHSQGVL